MAGEYQKLTDAQRPDWLPPVRSDNVGPRTFRMLLNHYGDARAALAALPDLARRGGAQRGPRICSREDAEREMASAHDLGVGFVALDEPEYPPRLKEIDDAPPLLAVRGERGVFDRPMLAMVGARNASAAGQKFAERLARDLGAAGFVIVSGLARGIDASAHRASLATGTVAVLAGGHARIYPAEHADLLDAILAAGAAVPEMPLTWEPRSRDFPRRNRLISGLSLGVVVVEATLRSGSLITARLAGEQGREVFAVPGSPLDPRCHGSNNLIRQGAALTESAEDVLRGLGERRAAPTAAAALAEPDLAPVPASAEADCDKARTLLIEHLSPSPTAVDELVRQTELPPALVASALLELELAGRIERHPGNRVARLGA